MAVVRAWRQRKCSVRGVHIGDFRETIAVAPLSEGGCPITDGASHEIEQQGARRPDRRHRRRGGVEPWRVRPDPVPVEERAARAGAAGAYGGKDRDRGGKTRRASQTP